MSRKQRPWVHELKTEREPFEAVRRGRKHVELRRDDRDYQAGDLLVLREWDGELGKYTGRHCLARVTHLVRAGDGDFGTLAAGVVAMSLRVFREPRSI
ncbi:MAG TPA: DUF3850 domain-containing protein [Chloroflexota bacterium]|nr:DUF3850 domain-containing protein [Chloroflexota bacterium]